MKSKQLWQFTISDLVIVGGFTVFAHLVNADPVVEVKADLEVTGDVGIGTDTPGSRLVIEGDTGDSLVVEIMNEGASTHTGVQLRNANSTPASYTNIIEGQQARNTIASPSTLQNGDFIFGLQGALYANSGYQSNVGLYYKVDGTPGTNDYPTCITLETTGDGSSIRTERMRITNGGNVGIGTSAPTYMVEILDGAGAQNVIKAARSGETIFTLSTDANEHAHLGLNTGTGVQTILLDAFGTSYLNTGYGLGINTSSLIDTLTIEDDGFIALGGDGSVAGTDSDYGKVYAKRSGDVEVFAKNEVGTITQLTSHANPRDFGDPIGSSFDDPNIVLPFSFHHSNEFIGKGAVIDLAALVADVESLTGNLYTTVYDMSPEETVDVGIWQAEQQDKMTMRAKERVLSESPEIETTMGDALEEVEILRIEPVVQEVTKYRIDYDTAQVIQYTTDEVTYQLVGTGEYETRLKEGYRFDENTGKIYRTRTLADAEIDPIPRPELPAWIVDRLPPSE